MHVSAATTGLRVSVTRRHARHLVPGTLRSSQLSIPPAAPEYCRATPTECSLFLMKPSSLDEAIIPRNNLSVVKHDRNLHSQEKCSHRPGKICHADWRPMPCGRIPSRPQGASHCHYLRKAGTGTVAGTSRAHLVHPDRTGTRRQTECDPISSGPLELFAHSAGWARSALRRPCAPNRQGRAVVPRNLGHELLFLADAERRQRVCADRSLCERDNGLERPLAYVCVGCGTILIARSRLRIRRVNTARLWIFSIVALGAEQRGPSARPLPSADYQRPAVIAAIGLVPGPGQASCGFSPGNSPYGQFAHPRSFRSNGCGDCAKPGSTPLRPSRLLKNP
jgi:hypothetical protein